MITYIKGDVTQPVEDGPQVLCHICNNRGGWGAGVVLAISKRWSLPEEKYRRWFKNRAQTLPLTDDLDPPFLLGEVQFVQVEKDLWVANMLAQDGYFKPGEEPPVKLDALAQCLAQVNRFCESHQVNVIMPRIGCGLGGRNWENEIEPLIQKELKCQSVTVYDFEPKAKVSINEGSLF